MVLWSGQELKQHPGIFKESGNIPGSLNNANLGTVTKDRFPIDVHIPYCFFTSMEQLGILRLETN